MGFVLCVACAPAASGALGPQGYEHSLTKYRVNYVDVANQTFLPSEWLLDNYTYNPSSKLWKEKRGLKYRAERRLDEDGDGTVTPSEKKEESIYDLRFVHSRDNAVIWLKVHPLQPNYASVDLDVILDDYADGLEGTGLFEQSSLFGLEQDKARHFTTFMVKKEATSLGALPAIRGIIEIADVEKLRLDPAHRDSKAELLFAKITYLEKLGGGRPAAPRWPIVKQTNPGGYTFYSAQRTGLLVVGYYDDAARFESHAADLKALLAQIEVPASAVPPDSTPLVLAKPPAPAALAPATVAPAANVRAASAASASAPAAPPSAPPAPAGATAASASRTPSESSPTASPATSAAPVAAPAPSSSSANKTAPAAPVAVPSVKK